MFFSHDNIRTPERDQRLWRYIDLTKFADLLITESLFFPAMTRLNDPWEGSLPDADAEDFERLRVEQRAELSSPLAPESRYVLQYTAMQRERTYVSCWQANDVESHAMWNLYVDGYGVAIRTTVGRLIDAANAWNGGRVYIGSVDYLDFSTEKLTNQIFPGALLTKDKSYGHEQEVRAFILDILDLRTDKPVPIPGVRVSVSPPQLLEAVVTAPSSPEWVVRVVKWLLEANSCSLPLQRSRFSREARF